MFSCVSASLRPEDPGCWPLLCGELPDLLAPPLALELLFGWSYAEATDLLASTVG